VKGCGKKAIDTAHVIRTDGRRSNEWYLVRTCRSCNHNPDPFPLRSNAVMISVNEIRERPGY
jgi:5-methylcytosine-specific restriction endonuclease McrA